MLNRSKNILRLRKASEHFGSNYSRGFLHSLVLLSTINFLRIHIDSKEFAAPKHGGVEGKISVRGKSDIDALFVFGTRPEVIKMAPVIQLYRNVGKKILIVHTGQHLDMAESMLHLFRIEPDINFSLMKNDQSVNDVFSAVMSKIASLLDQIQPKVLFVQGDTTTAAAASLGAFLKRIPVAHIEAGLRTGDMLSPYPEELNRKIAALVCSLCFAPTQHAYDQLLSEGIRPERVVLTGNTIIDSLELINSRKISWNGGSTFDSNETINIVVTAHRRESFGAKLRGMLNGVRKIAVSDSRVRIFMPVHQNPNVKNVVHEILNDVETIRLLPPLNYTDFLSILTKAHLVITDSGGIQEEATYMNIPILVMRDHTERIEAVEAGASKLVGTDEDRIFEGFTSFLGTFHNKSKGQFSNIFGNGNASQQILEATNRMLLSDQHQLKFFTMTDFVKAKVKAKISSKIVQENEKFLATILTVYKRFTLEEQIKRCLNQTLPPDDIFVVQNEGHVDIKNVVSKYPRVNILTSSYNFRYHLRFLISYLLPHKYIIILDDDMLPEPGWFANTIRCVRDHRSICGANGRYMSGKSGVGDMNEPVTEDVEAAFVGHSWAFERKWVKSLFRYDPITTLTSEDHQFSGYAFISMGVRSFVTEQPINNRSIWPDNPSISSALHTDLNASWRDNTRVPWRAYVNDFFLNMDVIV